MKRVYSIPKNAGQRAIADIIENDIVEDYVSRGGVPPQSVRTIEDVFFEGRHIDIKTRDVDRDFSMPNLISVDRLRKNKDKHIEYEFVDYMVNGDQAVIINVKNIPIHEIDWSVLRIQNLGLGQLQLLTTDTIPVYNGTKEDWYIRLVMETKSFYVRQIEKFQQMIENVNKQFN